MSRIAVVNDDPSLSTLLQVALEEEGWDIDMLPEGEGAFEELKRTRPDLVLLDIRADTPEVGWQLLDLLALDESTTDIPVVIFSEVLQELKEREDWLNNRHIGILPKPFNIEDLYRRVRSAVEG